MKEAIKLVGYGIDTLILNVRYCDKNGQTVKQELAERLAGPSFSVSLSAK